MPVRLTLDERGVAALLIDRAAKRNALDGATLQGLTDAARSLQSTPSLRAVVLRSAGDAAFSGGADVTELAGLTTATARPFITSVHNACAALRDIPVPVIARIQGHALGAGLELAAACDIRIAAETASFGMPEVRFGIPSVVEAALLPSLIGWGRTRWLLLTGQSIDAARALAWGLIEDVAPLSHLEQRLELTLAAMLSAGSNALRLQKALIREWEALPPDAAIARGIDRFAQAWETDEPSRMIPGFRKRQTARTST
jgi:enoyl-CoA hydratase